MSLGDTLVDDVSGLIPDLCYRQELIDAEAINEVQAMLTYLPRKRFGKLTRDFLYDVHFAMFGQVWEWAGKRRHRMLNIGVNVSEIDVELKKLLDDLEFWLDSGLDSVEILARFHHRLVYVHPFPNGNGRWARLMTNIVSKKYFRLLFHWPSEGDHVREAYILALKEADMGNFEPIIAWHRALSWV